MVSDYGHLPEHQAKKSPEIFGRLFVYFTVTGLFEYMKPVEGVNENELHD